MRFELTAGEKVLTRIECDLAEGPRSYPATLILTDRRAVLTYARTPRPWLWGVAWMVALVAKAAAHAREQVRHQIRRDRFASVEAGDGGILVFHDSGEGYAHTSFAIKSTTPLAIWQERMERWIAGAEQLEDREGEIDDDDDDRDGRAPLPSARIIER